MECRVRKSSMAALPGNGSVGALAQRPRAGHEGIAGAAGGKAGQVRNRSYGIGIPDGLMHE
jgi:hypothetical protein